MPNVPITIIDYGSGNLHSISKALARVGAEVEVTDQPTAVEAARRLVLPGVGHFGDAMNELQRRGLVEPIRRYVASGRAFLGVCVGMQLLMEASEEAPGVEGLGLVKGRCERFRVESQGLKVPHMGWNRVNVRRRCPILAADPDPETGEAVLAGAPYFYFVHSYHCALADPAGVAGACHYGGEFTASLWQDNMQGTQFHPEKSQRAGLALLRNFVEMR